MRVLTYISKNYNYESKCKEVLNQFKTMATYYVGSSDNYRLMNTWNFNCTEVDSDILFNFIRDTAEYIILFHDYKDKKSEQILDFCAKRCIPLIIIANPIDEVEF